MTPQPITDLSNLEVIRDKKVWRPFMEKYDVQRLCEVGVFAGRNFFRLVEHGPEVAVAVDHWLEDGNFAHNDSGLDQAGLNELYMRFMQKAADKPFIKVYRESSLEAVVHFPNDYFDFIYIDGDHTYEGCLQDVTSWYPKLRPGGFMVGDDYTRTHDHPEAKYDVREAVLHFANSMNLTSYEIPGNQWATCWALIKSK